MTKWVLEHMFSWQTDKKKYITYAHWLAGRKLEAKKFTFPPNVLDGRTARHTDEQTNG